MIIMINFILFIIMSCCALYINYSWSKYCKEINDKWAKHCKEINDKRADICRSIIKEDDDNE